MCANVSARGRITVFYRMEFGFWKSVWLAIVDAARPSIIKSLANT